MIWRQLSVGCLVMALLSCSTKEVKQEPELKAGEAFFSKDSTQRILRSNRYYIDTANVGWSLQFKGVFEDFSTSARFTKTDHDTVKNITFGLGKNDIPIDILQYAISFKDMARYFMKFGKED